MSIFRHSPEEIRTDELDIEKKETYDWINPANEISIEEWKKIIFDLRDYFTDDLSRSSLEPGEYDPLPDSVEAAVILKLLRPDIVFEDIINNSSRAAIEAYLPSMGDYDNQILDYAFMCLYLPLMANKPQYQSLIREKTVVNCLQESISLGIKGGKFSTSFTMTPLAYCAIFAPEIIKQLTLNNDFFDAIKMTTEREPVVPIRWQSRGALRILFPDKFKPEELKMLADRAKNDRAKFVSRPDIPLAKIIFWMAVATAPVLRVEKGKVSFEELPEEPQKAEPLPIRRNF